MKITKAQFAGSSARVSGKPKRRLPEFAFIGRSNVGKSSLINMLTGDSSLAKTSSTPGKTKVVNHFLVNDSWYLVDLPGYGFARLPDKDRKELQEVVVDYISNSAEMVLLFVLLDSRLDIQPVDRAFLRELGEKGVPFALIYTKCDKKGPEALKAQLSANEQSLLQEWEHLPEVFVSSSHTGKGREQILDYIASILKTL